MPRSSACLTWQQLVAHCPSRTGCDGTSRDADDRHPGGDIAKDHGAGGHDRLVAEVHRPEHCAAGEDPDPVAQHRLAGAFAVVPERDAVEQHAIATDRDLVPDDDARAVGEHQAWTDDGGGMQLGT